jgi:uncharacterized membrane protein YfcA
MDLLSWLIIAAALMTGCWVQASLGFGMAIVFAPILILIKPEWVPFFITLVALYLCVLNTWSARKSLNMKGMTIPILARVPGSLLAAWFLTFLNILWIQLLVSTTVLVSVIFSFSMKKFDATPIRLGWAGFFSGFIGTITSIGGLPMAIVMQHGDAPSVRANMSFYFTIGCILSLVLYAVIGKLTMDMFIASVMFLPVVIAGVVLGRLTQPYVDNGRFRRITLVICSMGAVIALSGSLYEFIY